ncbi:MAG: hypothetical protein HRT61_24215, partial [Ekhidna sp.]|nr:hypothetical protein [Ekhidna sp.]
MKTTRLLITGFVSMTLLTACSDQNVQLPAPVIREFSANESEVASSANNFTFDLMSQIEQEFPSENYFISSFSISTALSMVMNGASENSQDGFIETLNLDGMSPAEINEAYKSLTEYIYSLDPSVTLNVANSNWYSQEFTIQGDFSTTLQNFYAADIFERDFADPATLTALNGWVENETQGKIKDILPNINPNDVMFLINAIYFKAAWTNPFDANETTDMPFNLADNQTVNVPTMSGEVKHWVT